MKARLVTSRFATASISTINTNAAATTTATTTTTNTVSAAVRHHHETRQSNAPTTTPHVTDTFHSALHVHAITKTFHPQRSSCTDRLCGVGSTKTPPPVPPTINRKPGPYVLPTHSTRQHASIVSKTNGSLDPLPPLAYFLHPDALREP